MRPFTVLPRRLALRMVVFGSRSEVRWCPARGQTSRHRPGQRARLRTPAHTTRFRLGLVLSLTVAFAGCTGGGSGAASTPLPPSDPAQIFFDPSLEVDLSAFEQTSSGLYIQDLTVGSGPVARRTSRVWIEYVGWLPDGTIFDGNLGGQPYAIRLGGNEVIRGWNEGIVGMRRGGIRRLVVRPALAYGSARRGDIPPGSTLVFYLELVDVD